jgi:hypothetical protein
MGWRIRVDPLAYPGYARLGLHSRICQMKRFFLGFGIFSFAVIATIFGLYRFNFYNIHVRYRLTVEVQDGEEIKTGSSVIDAAYSIQPEWSLGLPSADPRIVGSAPTVDLGEKGLLFLTFASVARTPTERELRNHRLNCTLNDIGCLPFGAYFDRAVAVGGSFAQKKDVLGLLICQSGPRDVLFSILPDMVRFLDINNAKTRRSVDPSDLASTFGPGVHLKRVILELTGDSVTPPAKTWPRWLQKNPDVEFSGD